MGKCWAERSCSNKIDNLAVVQVLQEGKANDSLLAAIARNIWMLSALFSVQLSVSGKDNEIADLLSGWWVNADRDKKLTKLLPQYIWVPTHIDEV